MQINQFHSDLTVNNMYRYLCCLLTILSANTYVFAIPTVSSNWWQYPYPYDVLSIASSQAKLQQENLIDSYTETTEQSYGHRRLRYCLDPKIGKLGRKVRYGCSKRRNKFRRLDGLCNDFENPAAGSLYYRFGRNVPLNATVRDKNNLYNPNPRDISRTLMERKTFIPVTIVNILVAGWVQFMTHDWFDSGKNDRHRHLKVPIRDDDPDFCKTMDIPMTRRDSCRNSKDYDTYQNTVTHWWDASQLYGINKQINRRIRTRKDGKLKLTSNKRLPIDPSTGLPITGSSLNWWVGLGIFHVIWTREHNYVCDMLKERNPTWNDEILHNTAKLIIAAVIAKIHTLEWTTAILHNDVAKLGLKSNWYGVSPIEIARGNATLAAWLIKQYPQFANGIPGSIGNPKNIRGVPYSLTQDFIAAYRLHPLLPDEFEVRSHQTDDLVNRYNMKDTIFEKAESVFEENSMEDLLYTFGNDYPGAMTLHNYPNFLRNLDLPASSPHGKGKVDMATIDILRDRERGIPRYNAFRRLFHMTPITKFEDLTTNPTHAEELRHMYNNDVEEIDFLIGSLAESPLPEGFGFSDTFFRIFTIMARRRMEADRFFTDDYTSEYYTQWGLDYIDATYTKDILLRHYPSLASQLQPNVTNVFIPWKSQTSLDKNFPYPLY
ncbi:Hypothetical predicted protein [Mytilus galloprovincialis]|uniref:Uncharacterized protein n=2 Tax=Mytilus galloprovincialis TaxID=29158 RepID=A0A8B6GHL7_MYTGA|nr:Hypothetical predicted protein [Mytilus galloprovincialis]